MSEPVGIGVIGAGTISDTYVENLTNFADEPAPVCVHHAHRTGRAGPPRR